MTPGHKTSHGKLYWAQKALGYAIFAGGLGGWLATWL